MPSADDLIFRLLVYVKNAIVHPGAFIVPDLRDPIIDFGVAHQYNPYTKA